MSLEQFINPKLLEEVLSQATLRDARETLKTKPLWQSATRIVEAAEKLSYSKPQRKKLERKYLAERGAPLDDIFAVYRKSGLSFGYYPRLTPYRLSE